MHPAEVYVKGEPANKRQEAQFVPGKILTRFTTSLDQVYGDLDVDRVTRPQLQEAGGHRLPAGHRAAARWRGGSVLRFSSKELDATADGAAITTSTDFERQLPRAQLPHLQLP
jgi:photosystem II oxygen-evolving enhancer protein 1